MARICVLVPYHWGASRGGAELQAHLLADYLHRTTTHEIVYLARHVPDDLQPYRYEIRQFGTSGWLRRESWGHTPNALDLYRALKELAPDVIVHMVASAFTGVAVLYARIHHALFYWYLASDMDVERFPNVGVRSPMRHLDRLVFRFGALYSDFVVAQTRAQAERLRQNLGRMASLQIGNFFEVPALEPEKREVFTVVWIANLKGLKRPELFVELARRVSPSLCIDFRMIGKPSEIEQERLVMKMSCGLSNFAYLGELSLSEVEIELAGAHLLVNTSDYEGFPNTFIQAWQQEVPVYSLNVDPDGVLELQGIGKRLVTMDRLCDAVIEAHSHREELAQAGERARAYAAENHSMANARRLLDHIEEQIGLRNVEKTQTQKLVPPT